MVGFMRTFTLILLALAANPFRSAAQMPIITNQPASRVVWAGANVTLAVGLSNPPPQSPYAPSPFVYRWFFTPATQATPVDMSARATNLCAGASFMGIPLPTVAPSPGALQGFYISYPNGLAVRPDGTLLVADALDNYVFQSPSPVTPLSTFSVLAGTGPPFGFAFPQFDINDGGAGWYANVSRPLSVAADAAGNAFIVDSGHSRIRKVDTNGIITTVAGGGVGDYGPATNAILYIPMGLAADNAGNLFVADYENDRVRKLSTNGLITTVVGTGWWSIASPGDIDYEYHHPQDVAVDTSGNTFVAFTEGRMVIKVATNGAVTTIVDGYSPTGSSIGDGGPAALAYLKAPTGVAVDSTGNLYIADSGSEQERIRKVDTNGIITTVAGGGTNGSIIITVIGIGPGGFLTSTNLLNGVGDGGMATNANISVGSVALDAAGNLIFPDYEHNSIRKVDTNGIITTIAGGGTNEVVDGGLTTNAALFADNVALDAAGNIFISLNDFTIRKIDTNGVITTVAGNGTSGYSGDGGAATNANLPAGGGLAVDNVGNLFISDPVNYRIRKVAPNGIINTIAGITPLATYAPSYGYDPGPLINAYYGDGGLAASALLNNPTDVALDRFGNLYIADTGNYRVRKVDTNGLITTFAGNGTNVFYADGLPATTVGVTPVGLGVDLAGDVLIVDSHLDRILKVDASGAVTTLAGNGSPASSGDGGPAPNAGMSPAGLAVDPAGNVFIADNSGPTIREILTNGVIITAIGTNAMVPAGGMPVSAPLQSVHHLAMDTAGNLFVAASSPENYILEFFEAFPAVNPEQASVLTLSNVTVADSGTYYALAMNPPYSVPGPPLTLTVATSPMISQCLVNPGGSMRLDFVSPPASTNVVLCATNLAQPVWQALSTNVAGLDGDWQFVDVQAVAPARFYRFISH
jgi:sugar lactone lactonase YvrE